MLEPFGQNRPDYGLETIKENKKSSNIKDDIHKWNLKRTADDDDHDQVKKKPRLHGNVETKTIFQNWLYQIENIGKELKIS